MAGNDKRAAMLSRLREYYEDCQLHLQMLHRMYADHVLPESVYLAEIEAITAEMTAVNETILILQRRQNS